jgi:hypothetical protein
MFTVKTIKGSNAKGTGSVRAMSNGRQRTVQWDHAKSVEANHASAVGALLNVLADDRQQAMLRHPSGGQRVRVTEGSTANQRVWSINV